MFGCTLQAADFGTRNDLKPGENPVSIELINYNYLIFIIEIIICIFDFSNTFQENNGRAA